MTGNQFLTINKPKWGYPGFFLYFSNQRTPKEDFGDFARFCTGFHHSLHQNPFPTTSLGSSRRKKSDGGNNHHLGCFLRDIRQLVVFTETLKYWVGIQRDQSYLMERRCTLALVGHPSSDGVTIKIPYGVDL